MQLLAERESSQRQILKQLAVSMSSVERAIGKVNNEEIYGSRKKSGTPRKTSPRYDNALKRVRSRMSARRLVLSCCTFSEQLSTNLFG